MSSALFQDFFNKMSEEGVHHFHSPSDRLADSPTGRDIRVVLESRLKVLRVREDSVRASGQPRTAQGGWLSQPNLSCGASPHSLGPGAGGSGPPRNKY